MCTKEFMISSYGKLIILAITRRVNIKYLPLLIFFDSVKIHKICLLQYYYAEKLIMSFAYKSTGFYNLNTASKSPSRSERSIQSNVYIGYLSESKKHNDHNSSSRLVSRDLQDVFESSLRQTPYESSFRQRTSIVEL